MLRSSLYNTVHPADICLTDWSLSLLRSCTQPVKFKPTIRTWEPVISTVRWAYWLFLQLELKPQFMACGGHTDLGCYLGGRVGFWSSAGQHEYNGDTMAKWMKLLISLYTYSALSPPTQYNLLTTIAGLFTMRSLPLQKKKVLFRSFETSVTWIESSWELYFSAVKSVWREKWCGGGSGILQLMHLHVDTLSDYRCS